MLKNIVLILIVIIGVAWLMRESLWLKISPAEEPSFASLDQLPERNFIRDAHFCTEGLCNEEKTDGNWPIYNDDASLFQSDFMKILNEIDPKSRIIALSDLPDNSFRALTFSPSARFPDIIDVQLLSVPDSETEFGVSVFARALVGQKDFDANKKRLEKIRAAFIK